MLKSLKHRIICQNAFENHMQFNSALENEGVHQKAEGGGKAWSTLGRMVHIKTGGGGGGRENSWSETNVRGDQGQVSWRPTTVKRRQFSQSTVGTGQTEYHEALPSSANVQSHLTSSFVDDGNAL